MSLRAAILEALPAQGGLRMHEVVAEVRRRSRLIIAPTPGNVRDSLRALVLQGRVVSKPVPGRPRVFLYHLPNGGAVQAALDVDAI